MVAGTDAVGATVSGEGAAIGMSWWCGAGVAAAEGGAAGGAIARAGTAGVALARAGVARPGRAAGAGAVPGRDRAAGGFAFAGLGGGIVMPFMWLWSMPGIDCAAAGNGDTAAAATAASR